MEFSRGLVQEKPKRMKKNMVLEHAWREVFKAWNLRQMVENTCSMPVFVRGRLICN